ncbi:universal stress protein [Parapedobacter koreensis]|uniref:Nucleotide-binding universal stress protein, UspA family n=1 Tax=Parapedobacter koreensis TaxID=332977 RepID=A0A1H7I312_9SPHI|nr:universal stress protein [Parapedobacter koreensis]SEK56808.1 Nucleotide-binding universal stress protein, UspA family [Parapedobacter koreensis]
MKTLLVPTDFSQHAFNACLYAAGMAVGHDWKLHLLHVYDTYYAVSAYPAMTGAAWAEIRDAADEQMAGLITKLQEQFPSIAISGENREGTVGDAVAKSAREKAVDLVVMGTHGATGLKYATLGSNTFAVIQKSPVPVAAIPAGVSTFRMDRVGFAVNYHVSEITALESFTELINRPVDIILFHLYGKGKQEETQKLQKWEKRFEKITSGSRSRLHFKLAISRNLPVGINRMVFREGLNALVMTPVDKPFFDRLFSKQLVKVIAHKPVVPVFFMKGAGK